MAPDQASAAPGGADIADQLEQLQEAVNRAQQTIRQVQNATGTGIGNTTPAKTKGGIDIPPVSGVTATVGKAVVGSTVIQVTWVDAPPPTGASIDHYNVYIQSGYGAQNKPTLVGASTQSPCVFSFQPSGNVAVTVFVQTVLSNGQSLALSKCPTTTILGSKLAPSVISLLQGYLPQTNVQVTGISGSVGNWVRNVLTASNANGGALLSVDIFGSSFNGGVLASSDIGLRITIDGSASTQRVIEAAQGGNGPIPDPVFTNACVYRQNNGATSADYMMQYNVGFVTSCVVDIVGSNMYTNASGSVNVTVAYALHL